MLFRRWGLNKRVIQRVAYYSEGLQEAHKSESIGTAIELEPEVGRVGAGNEIRT